MKYYIYGLIHPETKELRYIGKTHNIKERLYHHIYESKKFKRKNRKNCWIKSLLKKKMIPEIQILEECSEENVNIKEIYYINHFKVLGFNLVNQTNGGDGQSKGYDFKGRYIPPKGKIPKGFKGLKPWNKGKKLSKEHIEKRLHTIRGKPNLKRRRKIICRDLLENKDYSFDCLEDASKNLNISVSRISNNLQGYVKILANRYIFRKFKDKFKLRKQKVQKRKVIKYNESELTIYNSAIEAAKLNKINVKTIFKYIKNKQKYLNYNWIVEL